jgi:hypothetical protein
MTELTEACAAIAAWLPVAQALTRRPDTDGTTGTGQPASRPPWNPAAAAAAMDAHEGLRRLEASMRREVTGHPGPRRGGSDDATTEAIKAIENLGNAVTAKAMAQAARILDRWSRQIQELPAIDQAEPWRRLSGVACPYCQHPMLRVRPRQGIVTCLRHGACSDEDGRHPIGRVDISQLSGTPVIRWNDGLVT